MERQTYCQRATFIFTLSLIGLAVLPLLPEIVLYFQTQADFKNFRLILYYEGIVSFLLFSPALFLPQRLSRIWVMAVVILTAPPTLILAFYYAAHRARWNLTAHAALFQTYTSEALGYLSTFISWDRVGWVFFWL